MKFRRAPARCTITKYTIKAAAKELEVPMTLEDADRFLEGHVDDLTQRLHLAAGRIVASMLRREMPNSAMNVEELVDLQDDNDSCDGS